jgi:hypothetical protein
MVLQPPPGTIRERGLTAVGLCSSPTRSENVTREQADEKDDQAQRIVWNAS